MARPKVEIDEKLVEKMASWGCKTSEIADYFECSRDTIERRFAALLTKGRATLKTNLRQWQLTVAQRGNVTMLIWLGKQMLGQTDKTEIKETLTALTTIERPNGTKFTMGRIEKGKE